MTFEEPIKIFKDWKEYMEIADKLGKLFILVPESFLPYPVETLEQAMNIVAKSYFDSGNKRAADDIQESMGKYLTGYYLPVEGHVVIGNKLTDEEVLKKMKMELDFMFEHPELLKIKLGSLKKAKESWSKFKSGDITNVENDLVD